jgi:hypothetical protein
VTIIKLKNGEIGLLSNCETEIYKRGAVILKQVFLLEHSYEIEGFDEIKTIGIFTEKEKAEKVIKRYISLPGFMNYPDGFNIGLYEIDKAHWEEGFIKWEDA